MGGYNIVAGFLIFFFIFIYFVWFTTSLRIESNKEKNENIKINPYDKLPIHRKLIDRKNKKIGIFDLGNHILSSEKFRRKAGWQPQLTLREGLESSWQSIMYKSGENYDPLVHLDSARKSGIDLTQFY